MNKGVWTETANRLGYRLELRRVEYPEVVKVDEPVVVKSTWVNVGVAPQYGNATLTWNLLNDKDVVLDWFVKHKRNLPGEKVELLKPGIYTLAVSVGRKDGKPEIALPLEGGIDRIYPVDKIEVVSKK